MIVSEDGRYRVTDETAGATLIETARSFLGLALTDARNALGGAAHVVPGDEYGRLLNVTSLESEDVFPGTLYVEDDKVRLVRIKGSGLRGVTRAALRSQMRGDAIGLRSRAGKLAQLLVYASDGIAFSTQDEDVHFLEAFAPCTHGEYETWYYQPPPVFIR